MHGAANQTQLAGPDAYSNYKKHACECIVSGKPWYRVLVHDIVPSRDVCNASFHNVCPHQTVSEGEAAAYEEALTPARTPDDSSGYHSRLQFHVPYEVAAVRSSARTEVLLYADRYQVLHAPQRDGRLSLNRSTAVALTMQSNGPRSEDEDLPAKQYEHCRAALSSGFCNNMSYPQVAKARELSAQYNLTPPFYAGKWGPAGYGVGAGPSRYWRCKPGDLLDATKTKFLAAPSGCCECSWPPHQPNAWPWNSSSCGPSVEIPSEVIAALAPTCPNVFPPPTNFSFAWSSVADGLGKKWNNEIAQGWRAPHAKDLYSNGLGIGHDVGEATGGAPWGSPSRTISSENSTWANYFTATNVEGNVSISHETKEVDLHFRSLPLPVSCVAPGVSSDCFWTHNNAKLQLRDGTYFSTVVIPWLCGWTGATAQSAGLFAFRSKDSLQWEFTSTIATVADFSGTGEGPNENDALQLPNGEIIVVMRVDGGDGTRYCHRPISPKNYFISRSSDGGHQWTKPLELRDTDGKGIGCARPRLLGVDGLVLLSGGRVLTENTVDIRLWVSADGANTFMTHSISYQHNRLVSESGQKLSLQANASDGYTTSYTSLMRVDASTILLAYDAATDSDDDHRPRAGLGAKPQYQRHFFMPITILNTTLAPTPTPSPTPAPLPAPATTYADDAAALCWINETTTTCPNPLSGLPRLPKAHNSWPMDFGEAVTSNFSRSPVIRDYARITHAIPVSLNHANHPIKWCKPDDPYLEHHIAEAVRLCAQKEVNCSITANFSPYRACKAPCETFWSSCASGNSSCDISTSPGFVKDVECYRQTLQTADRALRAANRAIGSDVRFGAVLFDQEYFGVRYNYSVGTNSYRLASTRAMIDAVNYANDAAYNCTLDVWPGVTIDQYKRGEVSRAAGDSTVSGPSWYSSVRGVWCGISSSGEGNGDVVPCSGTEYSLEEKGQSYSSELYSAGEVQLMREQFNRTVNNARAHGLSPPAVTPWLWLGGGSRRVVASRAGRFNDERWNYELIKSWMLGLE
eukprot:COSAG04_NODE_584_length_12354_cov_29.554141_4_plen_1028_part_00